MAVRVDVHDAVVQSYIRPGGEVHDLVRDVARDGVKFAKAYITAKGHIRSGRLLRGIGWATVKPTGALSGKAEMNSKAKHSMYVHRGTGAWIFSPNEMYVPKVWTPHMSARTKGAGTDLYRAWLAGGKKRTGPNARHFYKTQEVRGQSAKPFLMHGRDLALAKHGLMAR